MPDKFKLVVLFSAFLFLLAFPSVSLAQTPETFGLPVQQTLPGNPSYTFKRLKEKITTFFKFSQQAKFSYQQILLEKRRQRVGPCSLCQIQTHFG